MLKSLLLLSSIVLPFGVGAFSSPSRLAVNHPFDKEDLDYQQIDSTSMSFTGYKFNFSGYEVLIPSQNAKPALANTGMYEGNRFKNYSLDNVLIFDYFGNVGGYGYSMSNPSTLENLSLGTGYSQYLWDTDDSINYYEIAQATPILQLSNNNYYIRVDLIQFSDNRMYIGFHGAYSTFTNYRLICNVSLFESGDLNNKVYNSVNLLSTDYQDTNFFEYDYWYVPDNESLYSLYSFDIQLIFVPNNFDSSAYQTGYYDGYRDGEQVGYNDGLNSQTNVPNAFVNLLFSMADLPIYIIKSLFSFDLFGVSMFVVIMSLITGVIVIFLVKKFIH